MGTKGSLSSHKSIKKQITRGLTIYENKSKKSLLLDSSIFLTIFLLVGTSSTRTLESRPMANHSVFFLLLSNSPKDFSS